MPLYDVQCSKCGYQGTATIAIVDVSSWDQESRCPQCNEGNSSYQRLIKMAPSRIGSARSQAKLKSGEKDDMRHKEYQRRDPDQIAAAVESVKKGEFEGF